MRLLISALCIAALLLIPGCKPRCPEGQHVFVWQVNGVTNTMCVDD